MISMGDPIQSRGYKRGSSNRRYGTGKGLGQGRGFNGKPPPFRDQGMMRPWVPFRGSVNPPMPPVGGGRSPLRGRPFLGPPARNICPGPKGVQPCMRQLPPGMPPPLTGMSLPPPPVIMIRPPLPPPNRGIFRGEYGEKGRLQANFRDVCTNIKDDYCEGVHGEEHIDEVSKTWSCDNCEKDFSSEMAYNKHMLEHKVCNLDGCTFTAHEKILQKHIRMQHSTGLYAKIRNINTPEDIKKWIEDRKKKYPSSIKIEQDKAESPLKSKKKIVGKTKLQKYKSKRKRSVEKPVPKTDFSFSNEKNHLLSLTCPFKGTSELYKEELIEVNTKYDDEEWTSSAFSDNVVNLNNALGDLIGAYITEDEAEIGDDIKSNSDSQNKIHGAKEIKDDFPIECRINRTSVANTLRKNINVKKEKNIKRVTRRNKDKHPHLHKKHNNPQNNRLQTNLLAKLLANQIRTERHILLQCVKFVVDNNFMETKN